MIQVLINHGRVVVFGTKILSEGGKPSDERISTTF